jgi:hypothetical protein
MNQNCKPFVERLCEALGEDLGSPLCRELKDHVEGCPDCALQIDTVRRTVEVYRAMPDERVPSDMQSRLLAKLNLPSAKSREEGL